MKIIKAEEKWKEKHPHIAEQMDKMNLRLTNIETYIESEDNNGTKSSKDNES